METKKFEVLVQECEHTGDLERAEGEMKAAGIAVVDSWMSRNPDDYECGYLLVRVTDVEALRRACRENGLCSIYQKVEG